MKYNTQCSVHAQVSLDSIELFLQLSKKYNVSGFEKMAHFALFLRIFAIFGSFQAIISHKPVVRTKRFFQQY